MMLEMPEDPKVKALRQWHEFEAKAWVKAAFERGFDLRTLDDRELRIACFNLYNAELGRRAKELRDSTEDVKAPRT